MSLGWVGRRRLPPPPSACPILFSLLLEPATALPPARGQASKQELDHPSPKELQIIKPSNIQDQATVPQIGHPTVEWVSKRVFHLSNHHARSCCQIRSPRTSKAKSSCRKRSNDTVYIQESISMLCHPKYTNKTPANALRASSKNPSLALQRATRPIVNTKSRRTVANFKEAGRYQSTKRSQ